MIIILVRCGRLGLFLLMGLGLVLAPHWAAAENCDVEFKTAQNKLDSISVSLQQVSDKKAYLNHVKSRYEAVELLFFMANDCVDDQTLTPQEQQRWLELVVLLQVLQSSAQSSAFTHFDDWLDVKKSDLSAYQKLSQNR
ncbi:MAG: hypothetical protein HRU20_14075 [Pseudomonadales bacterium]|nr:hypothetical protein [Pseudomonadales bacterium]